MKKSLTALAFLFASIVSAHTPYVLPHHDVLGGSKAAETTSNESKTISCLSLDKIMNGYDSLKLSAMSMECVKQKDYQKASRLWLLAGLYYTYDTGRLKEKRGTNLVKLTMVSMLSRITEQDKIKMVTAMRSIRNNPAQLKEICDQVDVVGKPTYVPYYMMMTQTSSLEHNLSDIYDPSFDLQKGWGLVKKQVLSCDMPNQNYFTRFR